MSQLRVNADALRKLTAALFRAHGVAAANADTVSDSLVCADLEGVASHGVTMVPLYLQRINQGSVDPHAEPVVVEDHGGLLVMSAQNALGQISARAAVALATARARQHGVSVVSVRHAFHFGTASYWARQFTAAGMVGFAFSNTRPLMPAPGGAERVVGNNPMAIAFPAQRDEPLVVDMAMSATAMGKIRLAEAKGEPIPHGWATDAAGNATTSATEAIQGMLLPAAGPKGFGLAVAIDLLCGALADGAVGASVRPLYGELEKPYDCSHAFIAIDAARLHGGTGIAPQVAGFAQAIRDSRRAPDIERIYAPGDLERARHASNGEHCPISSDLANKLNLLATDAGIAEYLPV